MQFLEVIAGWHSQVPIGGRIVNHLEGHRAADQVSAAYRGPPANHLRA